ncbi:MAG: hypothetical protein KAG97_12760, partial [Victivallales bacterium]|nr:hypothetical protein [Victivallales bacterium]
MSYTNDGKRNDGRREDVRRGGLEPVGARLGTSFLACTIVFGLFAFAVASVMVADYYRLATVKPLTLPALRELDGRLKKSPDDERLKREIRELDLAARTFYFSTVSTFRSGAYLLAAGAALSLIFLHLYLRLRPTEFSPKRLLPEDPLAFAAKARFGLALVGLWCLAALSVAFLFFGGESRVVSNGGGSDATHRENVGAGSSASTDSVEPLEVVSNSDFESNWSNFRGFRGSAKVADPESGYPLRWNGVSGEGIDWKVSLPSSGFSSPIFWDNRLFATFGDAKRRGVLCVAAGDGSELWRAFVPFMAPRGTALPRATKDTGYAAPTMATDGRRVFAIFATGDIAAFDMSGGAIWRKSLGVPVNHYAYASSLLVVSGRL